MFFKSDIQQGKAQNKGLLRKGIPSIISSGLNILGNLVSDGEIEVEGRIEGNVTCTTVTIHRSGFIKGDITAESIHVNGEIKGVLKARNIKLSQYARVTGVIMYETLSIEDGAFVDGQCKNTGTLHRPALDVTHSRDELLSSEKTTGLYLVPEEEAA